ncbi:ZYRO0C09460p [Zygosaccharomyces rouxii]|uniref:ZYRO0C09460p n=1 Tax=Zygosaccharomyces rouxii (strain ATCC 2623 / CBS 732 / NBRC 1130 / NCYC 568 / NRRL Y-229) TaxID=559307 RepID=C5DTL3_ZYGRC|nr:uncharacterized protein ZYRO0C09460g [Zygosaccharomyces rouxii]KAH9201697.1 hypothetical protein LQ764DRAFT_233421 [Zygosaccharomyces rouxii]CAR27124.1 ZYRO0C09460p [Zygosaccharomyces rouxii]
MAARSRGGSDPSRTMGSRNVVRHQEIHGSSGATTAANTSPEDSGQNFEADPNIVNRNLNAYSIVPTTVPPYALDYQFNRLKSRTGPGDPTDTAAAVNLSDEQRYAFKDPFLVGNDGKWGKFASNIGSNVAYAKQRKRSIGGESSDEISARIRDSQETDVTDLERNKAKQAILTDLNTEWGGGKRLQELFDTPIMGSFEFQNNEDRQQWVDYVTRLKQYYYGGVPPGIDLESRPGPPGESGIGGKSAQGESDWIVQLHSDMERFRQLKKRKMQQWRPKLTRLLLDNQYLPLVLRMCIGMFSAIALGLAVRVYQNSDTRVEKLGRTVGQQPSTIMAICVNTIAIVYIVYIAQDEFTGKPLGLRDPLGKLRLILLDLLFIIFSSANLALAFNTLFDKRWVCRHDGGPTARAGEDLTISYICRKQRALSSFLFVMVVLWVITFTISLVRVVEKVSSASPR